MTPQKTTVDWLRFRAKADPSDIFEALLPCFGYLSQHISIGDQGKGILGFKHSFSIKLADMHLGRIDYGGDSQRDWARVDITGKGCEWVKDWDAIRAIEDLEQAEIRRLDIALTTWDGEITHDSVVTAHKQGRFITSGRPPVLQQITSSDDRAGRTCYIGKREQSDKFFRAYEKGFEMASKFQARSGDSFIYTGFDGKAVEDIYRCEVELKAVNKDIPWEVIERRDQYFAGAYPFCADILPGVEADILMRRPEREIQMDLQIALENCRIQFGPTLYTALVAYHGDIMAVFNKVVGKSHNPSLVQSGVLLVDHE
jgi:phage replication initiation protein